MNEQFQGWNNPFVPAQSPMFQFPQFSQNQPNQPNQFPVMQNQYRPNQTMQQPQHPQRHNDFFVLVSGMEDVKNTFLQSNQSMWFRFQ